MKLRDYQKIGMRFLISQRKACLFWEMRLGKTIVAVKSIKVMQAYPCLIVTPFSAFLSWEQEINNNNSITYLIGTKKKRIELLNKKTKYYIINTEGFLSIPNLLYSVTWGSMIIDESRCIANPQSKISKFFVNGFKNVPIKFLLTGTPATENKLEFVQQLRFIDSMSQNYWQFRNYYCRRTYLYNFVLTKNGKEKLQNILKEKAYFLKLKNVNLETKKVYIPLSIFLSKKITKKYNEIINKMQLDNFNQTNYKPVAFTWARRLLGGFFKNRIYNQEKFLFLKNLLIDNYYSYSIIIYCSYTAEIYFLKKYLSFLKNKIIFVITGKTVLKERYRIINIFNKNINDNILICQPEVTKFGLNLSGANTIIFYSTPLGLETRYQCEARAMLPEKKCITIIDLICKKTIEESIYKSIRLKEKRVLMFERLIQFLQRNKNNES